MTDVFSTPTSDTQETTTTTEGTLDQLVGEGKKYKTIEDLASSRVEADNFIQQLKDENANMRKDMETLEAKAKEGATVKDILDKLQSESSTSTPEGDTNQNPLTEEKLQQYINSHLDTRDVEKTRSDNRTKANELVLSKFNDDADKAKEFIASKAKEVNLSVDDLGKMSETSPAAFAKLLELDITQTPSPQGGVSGLTDVNVDTFSRNVSNERDYAFYQNMKKDIGHAKYYSPKVQQALMKDYLRLGPEKFGLPQSNK